MGKIANFLRVMKNLLDEHKILQNRVQNLEKRLRQMEFRRGADRMLYGPSPENSFSFNADVALSDEQLASVRKFQEELKKNQN